MQDKRRFQQKKRATKIAFVSAGAVSFRLRGVHKSIVKSLKVS